MKSRKKEYPQVLGTDCGTDSYKRIRMEATVLLILAIATMTLISALLIVIVDKKC